jgi:hypothetical protein
MNKKEAKDAYIEDDEEIEENETPQLIQHQDFRRNLLQNHNQIPIRDLEVSTSPHSLRDSSSFRTTPQLDRGTEAYGNEESESSVYFLPSGQNQTNNNNELPSQSPYYDDAEPEDEEEETNKKIEARLEQNGNQNQQIRNLLSNTKASDLPKNYSVGILGSGLDMDWNGGKLSNTSTYIC